MKRFNYLLGQTELFQHFIDLKVDSSRLDICGPANGSVETTRAGICSYVGRAAIRAVRIEGEEGGVSEASTGNKRY